MGQNVKKMYTIFDYLRGPGGPSMIRLDPSASQLSFHPYLCTCKIRKQSDRNFLSSNPKYEKNICFLYLGGGGGGLMLNPRLPNFQGSTTSSQSRHMYNKEKYNYQFFIYEPDVKKISIFGLGTPSIIRMAPICFPATLSPISIYI